VGEDQIYCLSSGRVSRYFGGIVREDQIFWRSSGRVSRDIGGVVGEGVEILVE
jgi:hypothetical protein